MREILFRGKRIDNGEWAYGCLICYEDYCCIFQFEDYEFTYTESKNGTIDGVATPVIGESVGQYTGLKDKNGRRIFDGDIVFAMKGGREEYRFIVRFGICGGVQNVDHPVGYTGFYLSGADAYTKSAMKYGHRDDIVYHLNSYECEVIGNAHDNPELLEDKL